MSAAIKAGTLSNGYERNRGRVVHEIPGPVEAGSHRRAACGAEPGRRSAGWIPAGDRAPVTCPDCQRALARGA